MDIDLQAELHENVDPGGGGLKYGFARAEFIV